MAGNTKEVQGFFGNTIKMTEFFAELTGFNAAAEVNKGKSVGAVRWRLT